MWECPMATQQQNINNKQGYKVLASRDTEMNEGWVWISNDIFRPRSVIKIKNKINEKTVYCEHLKIDENFITSYNSLGKKEKINRDEKTIVISQWYREKLGGIITKERHDLQITSSNGLWGRVRACQYHPQLVVRLSINLAILSVVLGILSVCPFNTILTKLASFFLNHCNPS